MGEFATFLEPVWRGRATLQSESARESSERDSVWEVAAPVIGEKQVRVTVVLGQIRLRKKL
jgi:hypothetical protein